MNVALANEFALIAERIGVDVWEAIRLANHHPRVNVLTPGPGVGGHCIAVDPWFLVGAALSGPSGASGAPSQKMAVGPGPPRFCVRLVRNRRGPLGEWMLEFDRVEQRFNAPADREPVAKTALDRPRQAASA